MTARTILMECKYTSRRASKRPCQWLTEKEVVIYFLDASRKLEHSIAGYNSVSIVPIPYPESE